MQLFFYATSHVGMYYAWMLQKKTVFQPKYLMCV